MADPWTRKPSGHLSSNVVPVENSQQIITIFEMKYILSTPKNVYTLRASIQTEKKVKKSQETEELSGFHERETSYIRVFLCAVGGDIRTKAFRIFLLWQLSLKFFTVCPSSLSVSNAGHPLSIESSKLNWAFKSPKED